MTLLKLSTAPVILLEDDYNINILPLLKHLVTDNLRMHVFCYEQSVNVWKNVFHKENVLYHTKFDPEKFTEYTDSRCCVFIDSLNQMALDMGWYRCFNYVRKLKYNVNVVKLILVLHKDCLQMNSKLQKHLRYIANGIVSYSNTNPFNIAVILKLGNKLIQSEEVLSYDGVTSTLKSERLLKEVPKEDEPIKPTPEKLTTFKIEVDQIQQMEKYKLKLPYMSKINEGQSKVYYEPDAVDDWDDEDPDDDLDI